MDKRKVCAPILSLFLLSIAGFLLHLRIHPPGQGPFYWVPPITLSITAFVLPFLFYHRKTVKFAYLINAAAVITGAATMGYFSAFIKPPETITLYSVIFETTLADIVALSAKLPLAHIILRHFYPLEAPATGTPS